MKQLCLVLILGFLITSCNEEKGGGEESANEKNIEISLDEKKTVLMSDIFNDINYTQLEDIEERLIGNIQKVVIRDDIIFIFESTTPSIFLYDLSGEYINQVVLAEGRGPQELIEVRDFTVNPKQKEITVLAFQEIHTYSFDGKFLERKSLKTTPTRIAWLSNERYALFMNNSTYSSGDIKNHGYNLLYIDDEDISQKFLKIKKYQANLGFRISNNFPRYNNHLLLSFHPSYNIYELDSTEVSVRYRLDFGDDNVPSSLYRERKNLNEGYKFIQKTIEEGYASFLANFLETDSLIYFSIFWDRQKSYPVFYAKDSGDFFVAKELVNDVDGGLSPYFTTTFKDQLVAFIQPSELLERVNKLQTLDKASLNKHQEELIQFSKGLDALDNPIIMFADIKSSI